MSFEIRLMKFVERMLIWGRKRETRKHPDDVQKLADIDKAIGEVRQDRAKATDEELARLQRERSTLD
jgi:hypothetical protein